MEPENEQTNITGVASGLDGISINEVEDQRDVPGGGITKAKQALGYREGTCTFNIDENSITGPLFHGKNGRRFYVTHGPQGNGTGNPKRTFEAIATITHNIEERGARRFNVTLSIDGLIKRTVFA